VVKANHIGLPNAWHPVTAKLIDSIRYGAGIRRPETTVGGILDMETKDIITLSIAIYGAILSSGVTAYTVLKGRRRIKVDMSPSFFVYGDGEVSTQIASIDVIQPWSSTCGGERSNTADAK